MAQISSRLKSVEDGIAHYCPGCNEMHVFAIDKPNYSGAKWTWDGNLESPTCKPSMNIRINMPDMKGYCPTAGSSQCHYFLTSGQIQFGGDCTHDLKGQTVPLPILPESYRDK